MAIRLPTPARTNANSSKRGASTGSAASRDPLRNVIAFSLFGFMQAQDFPPHAPHHLGEKFHVGSNLSAASIGADSAMPDGSTVQWSLRNELDQVICSYATEVHAGSWRVELPQPYIDQIQAGAWRVEVGV